MFSYSFCAKNLGEDKIKKLKTIPFLKQELEN